MHVIEYQEERSYPRQLGKELSQLSKEGLLAMWDSIGYGDKSRKRWKLFVRMDLPQGFQPWTIRRGDHQVVTTAPQHQTVADRGLSGEPFGQGRFADARFATDEHQGAVARQHVVQSFEQQGLFTLAADKRTTSAQ